MTQKLTCVIIDDEPPAIRILEKFVKKIPSLELIATFTKSLEALSFLETQQVDLIFLDVQMPEITGIQLSKIIHKNIKVVFTTAYPDFALESYNVAALDYLLKPIEFERFYAAVRKALPQENSQQPLQETSKEYTFFKSSGKNKFVKVFFEDIQFVQGLKNYVAVELANAQVITHSTLKSVKELLSDADFVQVHKSYIVALKHIDRVENDSIWVGNKQLPIGNSYRKAFFEKITQE
jgi:DNA-binding LytR/AlgR family response regulator